MLRAPRNRHCKLFHIYVPPNKRCTPLFDECSVRLRFRRSEKETFTIHLNKMPHATRNCQRSPMQRSIVKYTPMQREIAKCSSYATPKSPPNSPHQRPYHRPHHRSPPANVMCDVSEGWNVGVGFARVLDVCLVVVRTQVLVVVAVAWLPYACFYASYRRLPRGGDGDQRGSHICALPCAFVDASEALL